MGLFDRARDFLPDDGTHAAAKKVKAHDAATTGKPPIVPCPLLQHHVIQSFSFAAQLARIARELKRILGLHFSVELYQYVPHQA